MAASILVERSKKRERFSSMNKMTLREKILYHQIHPAKLLIDCATSFASSYLLWEACWTQAGVIAFLPSLVVTLFLLVFGQLECLKDTVLGCYIQQFMTRRIEAARLMGQIVAWSGAIAHILWIVPVGYFIVALAWSNGLWAWKKDHRI
jgi:hypothetical protein